ncbi:Hsp20/alpha crystallin family protein [Halomicrobium katesii]|uniref:Hsp20/alpha crystallin family protein n=1 Tax=Halomicrobium katesii TaxID=437163 RepID=UPI000477B1A5|nr:Hsp20/alpha crystallin family protein [Halomicrobium katesii]
MSRQPSQAVPRWRSVQSPQRVAQGTVPDVTDARQLSQAATGAAQQGWSATQIGVQQPAQASQQSAGVQSMQGQQPARAAATPTQISTQQPPVDVLETPDELLVLVDMAGFDEDDIQLDVDDDVLRIAASRTLSIDDDETLLTQERPTRFERYLQLPVDANIEAAKAKHEAGVCRITLPKSEQARDNHHRIGFQ